MCNSGSSWGLFDGGVFRNGNYTDLDRSKGKVIPLQALTGSGVFRSLRLPDFKTIGIRRWQGCQS
jgi:hypothetical protein